MGVDGKDLVMQYSDTFKSSMVRKLADPRGPSANQLSLAVGVPQSTLSRWLRESAGVGGSDVLLLHPDSPRSLMTARRPQDWTAEEKLEVVIEAASLPEEELGAFLRRKGLHEAHLKEWRQTVLSGLQKSPARSKKSTFEARRIRELERELDRKEKALAEAAALLVLKKKARAIWGDGGDGTAKKNGSES
jgi:transposase